MQKIWFNGDKGKGLFMYVDDDDFERANMISWNVLEDEHTYYGRATIKGKTVLAHHFILNISDSNVIVDHINRVGYDNTKKNLRICTARKNAQNRKSHDGSSSCFKGVSWHKRLGKWKSSIQVNGKLIHLGYFDTQEEAAREYDLAALFYFKEFSNLNFPNVQYDLSSVTEDKWSWTHRHSSIYQGVSRYKNTNRWRASVYVNGKDIHLGTFGSEIEAAIAHDRAVIKYGLPHSKFNFPNGCDVVDKSS